MIGAVRSLFARTEQFWRYYGVGVINTAFGYGSYALLVTAGLNLYAAQLIAHLMGMCFNYFMFRRHVFRGTEARIVSYILAYAGNYALSLALLALFAHFAASAYLAGLAATICASLLNYFVLKFLVFRRSAPTA